jgi:hypothetical protein
VEILEISQLGSRFQSAFAAKIGAELLRFYDVFARREAAAANHA